MPTPANEMRPFALRASTPDEYARLNLFKNVLRSEILPDDPPFPCEEDIHRWQGMPELINEAAWAVWDDSSKRILAFGQADIYQTGDNPHLIDVRIEVLPEFRRRGLGRLLLRRIADHARHERRSLMIMECNDRVPAGGAFLERIGGRRGLEEPINQLRLAELNRDLIQRWMESQAALAADFVMGLWDVPYPEEQLQALADLYQVVANDQPRDALNMEDINYSPAMMHQFDAAQRAGGDQRWSLYVTRRSDGLLAGISEVFWNPNRPAILWQGLTGVLPDHRNRGLGRWMKAAMLTKILRERPEVQFIRSGNATSNAPMLKINRALGFKQLIAWVIWQVKLDAVQDYLSSRI